MPIFAARLRCPNGHLIIFGAEEGGEELHGDMKHFDALLFDQLRALNYNPWCGVCRAPRSSWRMDIERMNVTSWKEAQQVLHEQQQKELLAAFLLKTVN